MELREHEHVVECLAWAPEAAGPAVLEAASIDVSAVGCTFCSSRQVRCGPDNNAFKHQQSYPYTQASTFLLYTQTSQIDGV